jgi:hypothetical protein
MHPALSVSQLQQQATRPDRALCYTMQQTEMQPGKEAELQLLTPTSSFNPLVISMAAQACTCKTAQVVTEHYSL